MPNGKKNNAKTVLIYVIADNYKSTEDSIHKSPTNKERV